MNNKRSPRDLTRPFRGEAAGLRTPAASHRPLPYLGCVPWLQFKLFVHYSFIIRALFVLIRAFCKGIRPFGSIEPILEALEGILGGLGGLLGSSWGVLGWSWGVLGRSWGHPGDVLGGLVAILGRHFEQSNF